MSMTTNYDNIVSYKQMIKEYVDDHFKHFGFYPHDVEVDGITFSYENYWKILNK